MNSEDLYKQFQKRFNQTLSGAQTISAEMQTHLRSAILSSFNKLDLVTREEFDAQRAVLARSREKIERLEAQLAELQATLEADK